MHVYRSARVFATLLAALGLGVVGMVPATARPLNHFRVSAAASQPTLAVQQAEGGCSPSGYTGQSVTAATALSRADAWVKNKQAYNAGICVKTDQGHYRPDCSGFVSMAWELDSSLITTQFNPKYDGGDSRFQQISRTSLQPGDAIVDDVTGNTGDDGTHHIALFIGWGSSDNNQHRYADLQEESDPQVGTIERDNQDLVSGYWSAFTPIHYSKLISTTTMTTSASSVAFASSGGNPFVAFRASGTGTKLWTWTGKLNTAGNGTASNDGVAAGTTPSIAVLPNGNLVVAFQAAGDNKLWIWTGAPNTAGNGTATNDGMAPGTSPSLALTPSGVAVVAFQANGGKLWTWTGKLNTAGNGTATDDGMAAGTSPSIALPGGGNPVVAFQANGGKLWTWTGALNTAGNGTATNDGMAPGTSPSLALLPGGDPVVAFQANSSGYLWTWTGKVNTTGNATATNDGMAPNTSPSIALPPAGGNPVVAFQANGGKLWTWTGKAATAGNGTPTLDGMAPGASPSIALPPAGGNPVVAFKANNTNLLWIWTGAANTAGNGTPTNDGMA